MQNHKITDRHNRMQKAPNVPSASSKPAWRMLPEGSAALLTAQHQQQHGMIKLTVSHKVAPRKRDTCKDPKARLAPRSKKAGPAPRPGGQQPASNMVSKAQSWESPALKHLGLPGSTPRRAKKASSARVARIDRGYIAKKRQQGSKSPARHASRARLANGSKSRACSTKSR